MRYAVLALLLVPLVFAALPSWAPVKCDYLKIAIDRAGGVQKVVNALGHEIKIGALIPMSGDLASFAAEANAVKLAVRDLNDCFKQLGVPIKVTYIIEDTQTNPTVAVEKAKKLVNVDGVKLIVGPATSAAVGALMVPINTELKVILMSHSSTSPFRRFENANWIAKHGTSYVFFSVSSDLFQAKALANVVMNFGYKRVVFFYRNDDYGRAFAEAFKSAFESMGGKAYLIPYDPKARTFDAELRQIPAYKPQAIVWLAFDEIKVILQQALKLGLARYPWFFTEAVKGPALLENPTIAKILAKKHVLGTAPAMSTAFINYYKSVYGTEPVAFSDTLYDAVWLVTLGALRAASYNPNLVARAIIEMSYCYNGFSGPKKMNAIYQEPLQTQYEVWSVVCKGSTCDFVTVGHWSLDKGLELYVKITPR